MGWGWSSSKAMKTSADLLDVLPLTQLRGSVANTCWTSAWSIQFKHFGAFPFPGCLVGYSLSVIAMVEQLWLARVCRWLSSSSRSITVNLAGMSAVIFVLKNEIWRYVATPALCYVYVPSVTSQTHQTSPGLTSYVLHFGQLSPYTWVSKPFWLIYIDQFFLHLGA